MNISKTRGSYRIFRPIIQLVFFLSFYIIAFNFIYPFIETSAIPITVPVLVSFRSHLGSVGGALTFIQLMLGQPEFPWIPLASILIVGAIVGRLLCGWACPFGFVQDLISRLGKKKTNVDHRTHQKAKNTKFIFLVITLAVSLSLATALFLGIGEAFREALGPFANGVFYTISPNESFFGDIPNLLAEASRGSLSLGITANYLLFFSLFLLAFTLIGAYKIPRFWCRYLCPLGAFMGILAKFALIGIRRDLTRCDRSLECIRACPMQIKILDLPWEKFTHTECILCLDCLDACPNKALKLKI